MPHLKSYLDLLIGCKVMAVIETASGYSIVFKPDVGPVFEILASSSSPREITLWIPKPSRSASKPPESTSN